jgi:repressor LexA
VEALNFEQPDSSHRERSMTDFSYYDPDSMMDDDSRLPSRKSGELFSLEVHGDSLADAGVQDGDIVILKPAREARDGEMAAIRLDGSQEITLKFYYREQGRVRLQSASASVEPVYIDNPDNVHIVGKVVTVIRQFGGIDAK